MGNADLLMVALDPATAHPRVLESAYRLAQDLGASLQVVYAEAPAGPDARERVQQTLAQAHQRGLEVVVVSGLPTADAILAQARRQGAVAILVGRDPRRRWSRLGRRSLAAQLIGAGADIGIMVVSGAEVPAARGPGPTPERSGPMGYLLGAVAVTVCSAITLLMDPVFDHADLILVYLMGVLAVSLRYGYGPVIATSILSVVAFDLFFIHPRMALWPVETRELMTFALMLAAAMSISGLTVRVRRQADQSRRREAVAAALYSLSRDLAATSNVAELAQIAAWHVHAVLGGECRVVLGPDAPPTTAREQAFPLLAGDRRLGALLVTHPHALEPSQAHLLSVMVELTAQAIGRAVAGQEAAEAALAADIERQRSVLLSAVSHDLRTPLATVMGAATTLTDPAVTLSPDQRDALHQALVTESDRMSRIVTNTLAMSRLDGGALLDFDWYAPGEIVTAAVSALERSLADTPVTLALAPGLPMVRMDGQLVERALINLLENALKHCPPGTPIVVRAARHQAGVLLEVADRGPGLGEGDLTRVTERFVRGAGRRDGIGLGLAICRAVASAHGGQLTLTNVAGGGLAARITLATEVLDVEPVRPDHRG